MKTKLRLLLTICTMVVTAGCAAPPPLPAIPPANDLFSDQMFPRPAEPVRADHLFTLSAPMRAYLHSSRFNQYVRKEGLEHGLVDALYKKGELKLEYDSQLTRDAAATYEAKRGNCLSLVIMTAAFAKELGLHFDYQNVVVDEQWSRTGSMYFASTHVNLKFHLREQHLRTYDTARRTLTVDFLAPDDANNLLTHPIEEKRLVAMYLNNRAAEELAQNRTTTAYWWARAAVEQDPGYTTGYNTLGVVYQRHGNYELAERVYKRALEREREDTIVMHNLVPVLERLGKTEESKALAARLKTIEPTPPFFYFDKGMKALEAARYAEAKALFEREVARSPYYHEFHFWLAITHWRLGESRAARDRMRLALDTSTTADATRLYSGKLNYLLSLTEGNRKLAN